MCISELFMNKANHLKRIYASIFLLVLFSYSYFFSNCGVGYISHDLPFSFGIDLFYAYIVNVFLSVIPMAFAVICFARILQFASLSLRRSLFFSLILAFATPLFPYSNSLWGVSSSTVCIIFSLYFYLLHGKKNMYLFLSGLFIATAVLCDYMAGAVLLCFVVFITLRERYRVFYFLLGVTPPILLLFYCTFISADSCSIISLFYGNTFLLAEAGSISLRNFSSYTVLQLLFSSRYGLLFASPILLFAFITYYRFFPLMLRIKKCGIREGMLWLSLSGIFLPLLLNACFDHALPPLSVSSRYIIVSTPFWVIAAAFFDYLAIWRWIGILLSLFSAVNMLMYAVLTPIVRSTTHQPLFAIYYPEFFKGNFGAGAYLLKLGFLNKEEGGTLLKWSFFNLGTFTGLNGIYTLLPLIFLLSILSVILFREISLKDLCRINNSRIFLNNTLEYIKRNNLFLLTLFCVGLIFLFLFPGDGIWINDEPLFIGKAYACNLASRWETRGLMGAVGMVYGPQAVWIYQILMLFSENLIILLFLKTLLFVVAVYYAAYKISRLTKLNILSFGILLTMSPYIYFYSRMLWDNVFLIPLSMLSFAYFLEFCSTRRWFAWASALFFAYFSLYLHPMSITWLITMVFVVSIYCRHFFLERYRRLIIFFMSVLLPALPFLYNLIKHFSPSHGERISIYDAFLTIFTVGRNLTFYGFFDYFVPEYLEAYPFMAFSLKICSFLQLIFVTGMIVSVFYLLLKNHKKYLSIYNFALFSCFFLLLFHSAVILILRRFPHPHYNNDVTFALIFIVWYGVDYFFKIKKVKYIIYLFFLLSLILLINFITLVHINQGTRGIHYGATLSNQCDVAEKVFKSSRKYKRLTLNYSTIGNYRLFPHAFSVLLQLQRTRYREPQLSKDTQCNIIIRYSDIPPSGKLQVSEDEIPLN